MAKIDFTIVPMNDLDFDIIEWIPMENLFYTLEFRKPN